MKKIDITMELRLHIARHFKTQSAAAEHWGVSRSSMTNICRGRIPPSVAMLADIGFEAVPYTPTYRKVKK